jgi:acetyl-CoA synthetase
MQTTYPILDSAKANTLTTEADYFVRYEQSVSTPDEFWAEQAQRLDWITPFTKVKNTSFEPGNIDIKWFEDGQLNVSANCIDRHLDQRGDQAAIIWEGDNPNESQTITYRDLHERVCRLANAMLTLGIGRGDVVTLYMPMIPEAAVAMLACTRIGAVHSIVFGGFSPEALAGRIKDCSSKLVITADQGLRGGKPVPMKENVDLALELPGCDSIQNVVVVKRTGGDVAWDVNRDLNYAEITSQASTDSIPATMNAEDPLFILYTSGSTGTPKGVLHTTGGYLLYAAYTHEQVFDYREGEVYWCTADVGWITGHTYTVYGPLCNGGTTVMFEGVPTYPDIGRSWEIVDKHQVNIFFTAPTAIRLYLRDGEEPVKRSSRASLRLIGTVGEPINPDVWRWYYEVVGDSRCPIVDTWWQTETGGAMISPLPGATAMKPGSATRPFFGVQPALVDAEGNFLEGVAEGNLVIKDSWPGQMRSVYGDHERFEQTYFSTYAGMYFTGDGARRDEDGYYWITGRVDDVINVSGHRIGTAEVESSVVSHESVVEAAVVGFPHEIKGQGIYVYTTLAADTVGNQAIADEIRTIVRKEIGPIAALDKIHFTDQLPKTRSGKIMRRILRKISAAEYDQLGDTSTLADPSVVDELIAHHKQDSMS